eukprot:scaffold38970_cov255-Skeletonema_dohrnii-CCMP3373.AAC.1
MPIAQAQMMMQPQQQQVMMMTHPPNNTAQLQQRRAETPVVAQSSVYGGMPLMMMQPQQLMMMTHQPNNIAQQNAMMTGSIMGSPSDCVYVTHGGPGSASMAQQRMPMQQQQLDSTQNSHEPHRRN